MRKETQISKIINAGLLMASGLIVFKFLPMALWGGKILFDASAHVIVASFAIYCLWFFIDQNENWHMPFYIFSALILFVISVQRIIADAHNDIGLLLGFLIAILSIAFAEKENLKGKLKF
jgi:heme O synthase-like polyprenyltransferase